MIIVMNGKAEEIPDGLNVVSLLDSKGIAVDTVVVEINREIVPSDAFDKTRLNDGDHLEVLRFVGGG